MSPGSPNMRRWLLLCSALLGVVFVFSLSGRTQAAAGINQQINFQGRLLNSQGATVPDGNYNIEFKIYQDGDGQSVGDTTGSPAGSLKWTEDYLNSASHGVTVKNGYFSVQLGSLTAFGSNINWNQDTLWLSLNIGGTASCSPFSSCSPDGEMIPMKRLAASPYALNSGQLGGLTSGQFVQLAQGLQTDASTNTNSIYINKTGTGNLLDLQSGGNDAFVLDNSGNLAFGANANHTLSVTTAGSGVAGKSLTVTAGGAGSGGSPLAGGNLVLQGGAGGGTNGNGGNITIDAGVHNGTGTDGTISIGTNNASAITIGKSGTTTTIGGNLTANGAALFQNAGNSSTAFQIQNAAGVDSSDTLFNVDTTVPASELVANGSFEQDTNGWTTKSTNGGTVAISQATGQSPPFGSDAMQITTSGSITALDGATYQVSLNPSTTYALSFYAKIPSGSFTTLSFGRSDTGASLSTCSTGGSASTTWLRFNCTFTTGASTTGSPYIFIGQNDTTARTWYVDGVALQQVGSGAYYEEGRLSLTGLALGPVLIQPTANTNQAFVVANVGGNPGLVVDTNGTALTTNYATTVSNTGTGALQVRNGTSLAALIRADTTLGNTLTNGSFENSTTSWSTNHNVGGSVVISSDNTAGNAYTGNNTGKVVTTNPGVANAGMKYALTSGAGGTLANGTQYTLSFYAKLTSGSFSTLTAGHADDGSTETACSLTSNTLTTYWKRFICTFTTTNPTTGIPYIYIGQTDTGAGTSHTYFLDGVQLEAAASASNYRDGKIQLNGDITSPTVFKPNSDALAPFQIQNASGTDLFTVDSVDGQLAVGPAAVPANGVLTIGTNTTAASGGLYFGTDTDLYRSGSATLTTDGSLVVGGGGTVQGSLSVTGTVNTATISGGTLSGGTVSGGTLSATAVNGLNVSSTAIAVSAAATGLTIDAGTTGTVSIGATSTGNILLGGGLGANGCTVNNGNGNLNCDGTINGATVSGGTLSGGTVSGGTLTATAVNSLNVSGTAISGTGALTVDANGSNTISLGATSTGDILFGGGSGSTGCTVTNATGAFACTAGLQGTTLAATATNGLTLGTASANTGGIIFKGSGSANSLTLQGPASPSTNTLTLPNETGTICSTGSVCTGYAPSTGGNYIAKNTNDTSSASFVGNLLGLTNTNTGAAGVLSLTNSGTNSALSILQSGTGEPSAGQALILANNNTTTPTGNLIDLQNKGASKFSVDINGAVTAASTINNASISGGTLSAGSFTGGSVSATAVNGLNVSSTALSVVAAATGLTIDAGTTGTVSIGGTSTGDILLGGGSGANGCTVNNGNGNLACTGTINGATLSGGTLSGGTVSGGTLTVSAVNGLNISSTAVAVAAAATGLTVDAGTTGTISLGATSTGDILFGGGSGSTGCTVTNASGNFACTGTLNGATISGGTLSAGSFTGGNVSGGTLSAGNFTGGAVSGGTLTATAVNGLNVSSAAISVATAATGLTVDAGTTGTISLGATSTGDILLGGGSGSTGCTVTNSNGNFACAGTLNGATISGGTLSGGSFTGGSVSNGTFSGGTVSGGTLTATAVNGLNVSSTAIAVAAAATGLTVDAGTTGTISLGATSTGDILLGGGFGAAGCTVNNGNGNFNCDGTINGATLSGGTVSGGTISGGTLTVSAVNGLNVSSTAIAVAAAATGLTIDAGTTGTVSIGATSTGDILLGGGSGSTGCTVTNASGNFACTGTLNGATISGGTISGGTLSGTAVNSLNVSGTAISGTGALTIDANGSNTVSIGGISTGDVLLAGGSGGTGCTVTNASGNFACTGTITGTTLNGTTGINTGGGAGTNRIDSSGNLLNIGNLTTSGASTFATTGTTGFSFRPGTDNANAFLVQNAGGANTFIGLDTNGSALTLGTAAINGATTTISGGTGSTAIQLTQGTGGGIVIGGTGAGSTTAVQCGAGTSTSCGFANNATDHTTTVGSTTGTSLTTVQSGTGGISLSGNATVLSGSSFSVSAGATSLTGAGAGNANAAKISTGAASNVGLVVQGASSQAADLLQLQDSTGANLDRIDAAGNFESSSGYLNTAYGGLGAYSNLLTQSEGFNNGAGAPWTYTNVTTPSANTVVAPDGNTTAESLADSSSGGSVTQASGTAITSTSTTYNFSVWLKTASGTQAFALRIDGSTGGTGTAVTGTATTTWQRFNVSQAVSTGAGFTGNVKVLIFPGGTGSSGTVSAWGAQLVLGSTPGVYVGTTAATVAATEGLVVSGNTLIAPVSDSTTAFQIQNASNVAVLTVDTSGGIVTLGTAGAAGVTGNLKFNFSGQTGSISLAPANPGSNAISLTLPADTTAGATLCTNTTLSACNTAGALTNVAYLNATSQTFTGQNAFSRNGSGANDYSFGVTGTPTASNSSSLVRIGNAITGGNSSANGGTYLSIVEPSSSTGSAADFLNLQNGTTVELQLTSGGNLTVNGTYNGNTFNNAGQLTFGNAGAAVINSNGSNNLTIDTGSSGGTEFLGNNAATTNIGTSNAAHTIAIGTGVGGTTTQAVTIGAATNGSSTLALQGGNGGSAISLATGNNGTTAGGIQVGNTTGAFSQTISIGTNATSGAANIVQIGTAANSVQDSVTIGSTSNANSSVAINAGSTGGIALGGNTTLSANSSLTYTAGTGSFDAHNASGTFQTSSGNNSLNGNTTVTGTNSFTVTAGATSLTGAAAGNANAAKISSGAASNTGLVIQGASAQSSDLLQLQDSTAANLYRIDAAGNLESSSGYINTAYGGLGTYSNLLTQSEAFDNAAWTKTNVTAPTANTVVAPDGNTTAESLADSSSGGSVSQTSSTAPTNANYNFSVWLKTSSGIQPVDLRIDGATSGTGTKTTVTATTTWQRFSVTQNPNGFTGNIKVLIFPGGTGSSGTVSAWGGQLVLGSTPGVYTGTTASTVAATAGLSVSGNTLIAPVSDSTTAFQVQNASNVTVLNVDTTNGYLGVGTAAPSRPLDVAVNNSTVTALPLLVEQAGSGDVGIELKNASKSFYAGVDTDNQSKFVLSSSAANGGTSQFGNASTSGSPDTGDNGQYLCSKFTAGSSGTVTSIVIRVSNIDATNKSAQAAVYTDSSGTVGSKLGSSATQTLASGQNTFPLSASVSSGSVYWLCMDSNTTSSSTNVMGIDAGSANQERDTTTGFSFGTWPTNMPVSTFSGNSQFEMVATVTSSSALDSLSVPLFSLSDTGQTLFQNSANSSTAFQVENQSGNTFISLDTNASALTLGNSGVSGSTVAVACGAGTSTSCGFANNATDHTTTVGSTTGTSLTTVQSGTGGISLSGNTTVTGTNSFTVTGGATSLTGAAAGNANAAKISTGAASNVGLVIQGASAQSAKLLQIQDSTGANLLSFDVSGNAEQLGYFDTPFGGLGSTGNLLTQSEAFDNAAWTKTNVTAPTANTVVAPDGNTTAESLADSASGGSVSQTSSTAPTNANYTFSVWLKTSSGTQAVDLRIDGATSGTGTKATVTATTTWQRFSVTQNPNGFSGNIKVLIFPGGTGGSGTVSAWGGQLVLGSTPGVYVNTVGSTVAAGTGLSVNGSAIFQSVSNSATAFLFQNASSFNVLGIDTSGNQLKVFDGTTNQHYISLAYNDGTSTGTISVDSGTTAVGSGTGPISILAGSGSSITITSNAASLWKTTAGTLTLQSGTGASDFLILNSGGSSQVQVSGSSVVKLGQSAGDPGTCTAGAIVYNTTTNTLRGCQGSTPAWNDLINLTTPTLQSTYNVSTGGTTPIVKLNTTQGTLNVQGDNAGSLADLFNVRAGTGSGLGQSLFDVANTGTVTIQSSAGIAELDATNADVSVGAGNTPHATNPIVLVLDNYQPTTAGAEPTEQDGAMYYDADNNLFRCGLNGYWQSCALNNIQNSYDFEDDFLSGGTTNGTIGNMNWGYSQAATNCSAPAYNTLAASHDHPGVLDLSGTSSGAICMIRQGTNNSTILAAGDSMKASVQLDSTTSNRMQVGISNWPTTPVTAQEPNGTSSSGVWWEEVAGTANWEYCYGNFNTATCSTGGATTPAVTAGAWVQLEIHVISTGSGTSAVDFIANGTLHQVTGVTIDFGSTTAGHQLTPGATCNVTGAVTRHCYIDYYQWAGEVTTAGGR